MKNLLFIIILSSFINTSFSQNINDKTYCFGYIDGAKLLDDLPEFKNANSKIEQLKATYETEIEKMHSDLQKKIDQNKKEAQSKTEEENNLRYNEVEKNKASIKEYQRLVNLELQKEKSEKYKPIINKINAVVKKVADSKNLPSVFDSSQINNQVLLIDTNNVFLTDGYDLMKDVKKELELE